MADADYVRLAAACFCGEPAKIKLGGPGRPPRRCEVHLGQAKPKKKKAAQQQKQCPACRGIFISATAWQVYCTKTCGVRTRRGSKPRDEKRWNVCAQCGVSFESTHFAPMYCSKFCKTKAYEKRTPRKKRPSPLRLVSAYHAGHCNRCGLAHGGRAKWKLCPACSRADRLAAARAAAQDMAVAKHKAAGRTTSCGECGTNFCPLYGSSHASLCSVCAEDRSRAQRREGKAKRRAVERGAVAEKVDPFKVFERDGWRCQLCKVKTPRQKRGTYDDDAPELDHIVPLAKGGPHTYANTQCACRRCNSLKADTVLGQALLFG